MFEDYTMIFGIALSVIVAVAFFLALWFLLPANSSPVPDTGSDNVDQDKAETIKLKEENTKLKRSLTRIMEHITKNKVTKSEEVPSLVNELISQSRPPVTKNPWNSTPMFQYLPFGTAVSPTSANGENTLDYTPAGQSDQSRPSNQNLENDKLRLNRG